MISVSINYIRSSSGHSREAWPLELNKTGACAESTQEGEPDCAETEPLFMYGERIVSRKMRRSHRPMSALEHQPQADDASVQAEEQPPILTRAASRSLRRRPKSACVRWRAVSATSFESDTDAVSDRSASGQETMVVPVNTPTSERETPLTCDTPSRLTPTRDTPMSNARHETPLPDFEPAIQVSGRVCSSPGWPLNVSIPRATPRQPWENDTSEITKKIFAAQERAGRRHASVYQDRGEMLTSDSSRNFRGLERKGRIQYTSSKRSTDSVGRDDYPPLKTFAAGKALGHQTTFQEILNLKRPTVSVRDWRSQMNQSSTSTIPSID